MKGKLIFVITSFVLIADTLLCQNDFRNGFIITLEQDTIIGQVDYRSNSNNYKSCIFKGEQEESVYYPDEILGFGYDHDKFFLSQIVEGSFVEVLVLGEISLFKSTNEFHLKKDTSVYTVKSFYEEVKINGKVFKTENTNWKGIVSYLMSDCISNLNSILSKLRLEEKSLTELVVKYNECKGRAFTEFKTNQPWAKYSIGASMGIARSEIQTKNDLDYMFYMDASYISLDPVMGILVEMSMPRLNENLAVQAEIQFIKSSYSSLTLINTSTTYYDTYIDLSTLSVPLSLKYTFPEKRFGWYLQGGANLDYHVKLTSKLLIENVYGNVVHTLPERSAFPLSVNKFQLGYWGGVGIVKSFEKFKASIAFRHYEIPALSYVADRKVSVVNLIIFKK